MGFFNQVKNWVSYPYRLYRDMNALSQNYQRLRSSQENHSLRYLIQAGLIIVSWLGLNIYLPLFQYPLALKPTTVVIYINTLLLDVVVIHSVQILQVLCHQHETSYWQELKNAHARTSRSKADAFVAPLVSAFRTGQVPLIIDALLAGRCNELTHQATLNYLSSFEFSYLRPKTRFTLMQLSQYQQQVVQQVLRKAETHSVLVGGKAPLVAGPVLDIIHAYAGSKLGLRYSEPQWDAQIATFHLKRSC